METEHVDIAQHSTKHKSRAQKRPVQQNIHNTGKIRLQETGKTERQMTPKKKQHTETHCKVCLVKAFTTVRSKVFEYFATDHLRSF